MKSALAAPHFEIKTNFQKRDYTYKDILSDEILSEICSLTTGVKDFTVDWDDSDYNKGRLLQLSYKGKIHYITISNEGMIEGRNSAFQSVPSTINRFIIEENGNKEICYYFHPGIQGRFSTDYFMFMYRLMKTASIRFLNAQKYIATEIVAFATPNDIIASKDLVRNNNAGNKSTYITTGPSNQVQIFGKTYGASKYETTIICLAIANVSLKDVELFEIEEGGLTKLPAKSKEAIESIGGITIRSSNRQIEREEFETGNSLRSIKYTYNLLEKLGEKKCTLCKCEIPQIIQGAHIWPVADIKKQNHLTDDEKLDFAIDKDNGLWLCQNHHKLFDIHHLAVKEDGLLTVLSTLDADDLDYITSITIERNIPKEHLTDGFTAMLNKRNEALDFANFGEF
jgi:hypothetical protein